MSIKIAQAKIWREQIDATHIVVFAIGRDGQQHVATHGETEQNAREAAKAGNKLKAALGWPDDLCHATPLQRCCKNCTFFRPDRGVHCVNGWSGDGSKGHCQYLPSPRVAKNADDKCGYFQPR